MMPRVPLLLFATLFCSLNLSAADRPNVLIIGDSISLGYTPHVRTKMQNEANFVHNKGNAQHSGTGLEKIDEWLGDTDWDIIHFNWGLWDLCYRHPDSKVQGRRDKARGTLTTPLEQYEKNLDRLVTRLRRTRATCIWASTTVVPNQEAGRKVDDDLKYNAIATKVMRKHGVVINDVNKFSRTFGPERFKGMGDAHFTTEGYEKLAEQVTRSIRSITSNQLPRPSDARRTK